MTPQRHLDTATTDRLNSIAEDLFMELFCDTFGPEKSNALYIQYPFIDLYGNHRYIDFAIESENARVAIEIDGETWHNPSSISPDKYIDDLQKQNSMIHWNACLQLQKTIYNVF